MVLIGPTSRSVDLPPHGLPAKVFWPLMVHSQIWLAADGWLGDCAGRGVAAKVGTVIGTGGGVGAGELSTVAWGNRCAVGWPDDRKLGAAILLIEATVIASATVAIERPPRIHGRRSRSLSMAGLSHDAAARGANMTNCRGMLESVVSIK